MPSSLLKFVQQYSVKIGGRKYKAVKIGNQLWMAENLDYKFDGCTIGSGLSTSSPRGNYYNNDEATYGETGNKYGLLYNKPAVALLETNKTTLLPDGWHVPTNDELDTLIESVGGSSVAGKKLKATEGWTNANGTDDYEFRFYPTGYKGDNFYAIGTNAFLASKTPANASNSYKYKLFDGSDSIGTGYFIDAQVTVRLVKSIE